MVFFQQADNFREELEYKLYSNKISMQVRTVDGNRSLGYITI